MIANVSLRLLLPDLRSAPRLVVLLGSASSSKVVELLVLPSLHHITAQKPSGVHGYTPLRPTKLGAQVIFAAADVDRWWQAFPRRFDLEHQRRHGDTP